MRGEVQSLQAIAQTTALSLDETLFQTLGLRERERQRDKEGDTTEMYIASVPGLPLMFTQKR